MLSPFRLFGLGRLINRFVATLPIIRKFCLRNYVVARPRPKALVELPSGLDRHPLPQRARQY